MLEARDRIGGRIWTLHPDGLACPVETGAEFLHADARETRTLARRAGLTVVDIGGQRWLSRNGALQRSPGFEKRIERVLGKLRDDLKSDRSVLEAFSAMRSLNDEDRRLGLGFVEGFHAADPARISEQSVAGSANDPDAMRIARISGGYDQLVAALAAPSTEYVHLDCVVTRITWRRGEAVVSTAGRPGVSAVDVAASKVIVTLPLGVILAERGARGAVTFDPPVTAIEAAANKLVMGNVMRIALRFDEPFWASPRFAKLHGGEFNNMSFVQSLSADLMPVWWTAYPLEAPLLVGWTGGPRAAKLSGRTPDEICDVAVRSLASVFGMSRPTVSRRLLAYFTHDWGVDPFSRGAYSYVGVDGSVASSVLARPIEGTLYFAGEHASAGRNGTVDGAIASGYRAADQALRSRKHRSS